MRTIQSELENVLHTVLRKQIKGVCASGRTDAGVHARAQVVNFLWEGPEEEIPDLRVLRHSISNIMRGELSVLDANFVPQDFHSRNHAISKQYSYRILWRPMPAVLDRGFAWHISSSLDIERMKKEAEALLGKHDFSSFRGAKCTAASPVKEIFESEFLLNNSYLIYRVVGDGFLKQMVRNIVGTLVGMGKGRIKLSMEELLSLKDRKAAGVTAPPYGLYLDWVRYQGWCSSGIAEIS